MTEDEAKAKWCPFARAIKAERDGDKLRLNADSPVHNRFSLDPGDLPIPSGAVCISSACMMWRWDDELLPKPNSLSQGHCGLANK